MITTQTVVDTHPEVATQAFEGASQSNACV